MTKRGERGRGRTSARSAHVITRVKKNIRYSEIIRKACYLKSGQCGGERNALSAPEANTDSPRLRQLNRHRVQYLSMTPGRWLQPITIGCHLAGDR